MTRINLKKDEVLGFSRLTVSGHSGFSEEGSDIVCAYVSSATDLLMTILIDSFGVETETSINPEKAFVELIISRSESNLSKCDIIRSCMTGFYNQMKEFSKQFPKNVSIKLER